MMQTEIAFANERAIMADMLINLLTNVRLTYLPDLEPADAQELLLTGAYVLIAQLGSQPATAAEISRVIGRARDFVLQRLDELIKRGYVERSGNRACRRKRVGHRGWLDLVCRFDACTHREALG